MANCPKCRTVEILPVAGRASRLLRCERCHGTWFPKDEARLEAVAELLATDSTIRPGSAEDERTGLCPEGHGILIRAQVQVDEPFHLERCAHCHGIWFDKGEWNRLAESHLFDHLDRLWDPAWRGRSREVDRAEVLRRDLGAPTVEMIETLATALRTHDARVQREALAHLEDCMRD